MPTCAQQLVLIESKISPIKNPMIEVLLCWTYSNCKAAILEGKPVTMHVISHGRSDRVAVRLAPPLDMPLCLGV